ncbi:uncharacterized protein [Asterias amurensis]|uniref:uncharacterized protein n=1 Tax=Asterias amurensis TaxID=7602 RepID=UPI003AB5A6D4
MRSPISLFNRVPGQPTGSPISSRPPVHLRSQRAFQKHTVVNLSNRSITETETSVLSLGMNFAQPPKSIPTEEIIQSTEQALKHLSKTEKIDVRIKINEVLRKAKPAKSNLSKVEQAALRELRRDESIHILPADKGNATVIMDRTEYTDKVSNILSSGSYRPLPKDPTPSIEKRVASKLLSIHRSGALSVPLYRRLRPSSSTCPRFFGNPKIHKPEVPLRPIVASRESPTYDTAKYLAKVLRPLVGLTEHHVSNSTQFVDITRNLTLQPTDILVSFDVESLFTNVPTDEACFLAKERLSHDPSLPDRTGLSPDQIHDLLYTCVSSSCFQFQGKYYEQTAGTSMGSPISPVLADIFMEEFESSSLLTADLRPSLWLRYVDDTFVVWPHGQDSLHEFLQYLNQQHSSIKFTMEQEHSGKLPFLDVLITRNQDGTLHHSIYRKPTHTDRYLHQRSFHHPAIKSSVNRALVQRAYTICDPDSLQHELQHITTSLQRNGYNAKQVKTSKPVPPDQRVSYTQGQTHTPTVSLPYLGPPSHRLQRIFKEAGIKVYHSAPKKLHGSLQSHKDKKDPSARAGVYRIPCECGKVYVGETGRNLPTRLKEHRAHGRRGDFDKSAIVKHSHIADHRVNWDAAEIIAPIQAWHPRRIREAIEIHKHDTVPQDIGFHISDIWLPFLPTNGSSISTVTP